MTAVKPSVAPIYCPVCLKAWQIIKASLAFYILQAGGQLSGSRASQHFLSPLSSPVTISL